MGHRADKRQDGLPAGEGAGEGDPTVGGVRGEDLSPLAVPV